MNCYTNYFLDAPSCTNIFLAEEAAVSSSMSVHTHHLRVMETNITCLTSTVPLWL